MKTTKLASEEQSNEIAGAENEQMADVAASGQKAWAAAAAKKNSASVAAQSPGTTAPQRIERSQILSGKLNSKVNILLVDDRADKLLAGSDPCTTRSKSHQSSLRKRSVAIDS